MEITSNLIEASKLVHSELTTHVHGSCAQQRVVSKLEAVRHASNALSALGKLVEGIRPAHVLTYLERVGQLSVVRHDYHVCDFREENYN